jgi:hypothetical protein
VGEQKLSRGARFVDGLGALLGVLLALGGVAYTLGVFALYFFSPCGLSDGECSANLWTRVAAVGTLAFGGVIVTALILGSAKLFDAYSTGSPRALSGFGRVVLLGIGGLVGWVLWLLAFAHPSDTPQGEAVIGAVGVWI